MRTRDFPTCFPCYDAAASGGDELCFLINTCNNHGANSTNNGEDAASESTPSTTTANNKAKNLIGCNLMGSLFLSDNPGGWEIWRLHRHEDGTVTISSWTHSNQVLGSSEDGCVSTTAPPQDQRSGRWTIEKVQIGNGVDESSALLIRSVQHNRLLGITEGRLTTVDPSALRPERSEESESETTNITNNNCSVYWNLEPAHKNQFFVTSLALQKRISCDTTTPSESDNGEEAAFRLGFSEDRRNLEEWMVEFIEPGFVVFKKRSKTGQQVEDDWQYLSCFNDGSVAMSRGVFHWLVEPLGPGLCFSSGSFFLSVDETGKLIVRDISADQPSKELSDTETWILEPRPPESLSRSKCWKMAGLGAMGLATAVAAPLAVTAAVGALGFGSSGVVAGSYAAGMMSAEAVASGGTIAAGGTVATLQSIGAAGLGVAGTTASVSGGALLGGGIAAASSKTVLRDDETGGRVKALGGNDPNEEEDAKPSVDESFAAWREW